MRGSVGPSARPLRVLATLHLTDCSEFLTFGGLRPSPRASMLPLARNTLLRNVFELAEFYGVDRDIILREIELDAVAALQPGAFVSADKLIDAVEFAALATGRRDFGLLLGSQNSHRSVGPIGVLAEHCSTVADAAAEASRYLHLHNANLLYTHRREGDRYVFRAQLKITGRFAPKHYVEALVMMFVRFCQLVLESDWKPAVVCFEHERLAPITSYKRLLGNDVRFQQSISAVMASLADMDRPITKADPRIKRLVLQMLNEFDSDQDDNIAAKATAVLRPLLSSGNVSAAKVAALMSLSVRTLQRRLAAQGTSFQGLLTDIRVRLIDEYLMRSDMSLNEMADVLGLSEASAVSRFLQEKYGRTWKTLKKQARALASGGPRRVGRRATRRAKAKPGTRGVRAN